MLWSNRVKVIVKLIITKLKVSRNIILGELRSIIFLRRQGLAVSLSCQVTTCQRRKWILNQIKLFNWHQGDMDHLILKLYLRRDPTHVPIRIIGKNHREVKGVSVKLKDENEVDWNPYKVKHLNKTTQTTLKMLRIHLKRDNTLHLDPSRCASTKHVTGIRIDYLCHIKLIL